MPVTRRSALLRAGSAVALGGFLYLGWREPASAAPQPDTGDQRKAMRTLGDPSAKVTVAEFFSLTCTHCAAFSQETMPQIERELITPGKVRFVYHDFPLDQVALTAAMVARYLPLDRYYPFITALFANQDRWAFARGVNSTDELWKMAALAGMGRPTFDKAIADEDLRNWILQEQQQDQDQWKIDATPSFVINGQKYSGEMSYDAFVKLLPTA